MKYKTLYFIFVCINCKILTAIIMKKNFKTLQDLVKKTVDNIYADDNAECCNFASHFIVIVILDHEESQVGV